MSTATDLAAIFNNLVVGAAAIAGGTWAFRRYLLERTAESALTIELSSKSVPLGTPDTHLVFIEATLRNVGKTQIKAKQQPNTSGKAYSDSVESIGHSGTLEIKMLAAATAPGTGNLDWFDTKSWARISGLPPLDMLSEYEDPDNDNALDFWMEPCESYTLSRSVALKQGTYLAKLTFVGHRAGDFWTRLMQFSVPTH